MINSMGTAKIRNIDHYVYKDKILEIKSFSEKFLESNNIESDTRYESRIPKEKDDICYHLEFKNNIATTYENGNIEVHEDEQQSELKEFDWFFLKFYDNSLNEYISDNIKNRYAPIIEKIKNFPVTYGAFHYCTANTFIFEHYDQTTNPEGSETGRTNIIIPLNKPNSKGCIIHVDGEEFDLMEYDAFCFNAQFKHKMYNNTGKDVTLLVLHSRSDDFKVVSQV